MAKHLLDVRTYYETITHNVKDYCGLNGDLLAKKLIYTLVNDPNHLTAAIQLISSSSQDLSDNTKLKLIYNLTYLSEELFNLNDDDGEQVETNYWYSSIDQYILINKSPIGLPDPLKWLDDIIETGYGVSRETVKYFEDYANTRSAVS